MIPGPPPPQTFAPPTAQMGSMGLGGPPPPPTSAAGGGGQPPPMQMQQTMPPPPPMAGVPGAFGGGGGPMGTPPGGSYPGAQFSPAPFQGQFAQQSVVEDFGSLVLGGGGGPGQEQGADPATFPRPGDDVPNANAHLSCDPRYLRLTCGALPGTASVKQRFTLPVACVVRPMIPGENVPIAHFGSGGIVRCRRCRTYINPFVQFIDGGRRFRCNVCSLPNEVPVDYFCTLDADGRRRDVNERPELRHGTVEFLASQEYMVRPPMPPTYFFAIDVSANAVASGFLATTTNAIKASLDALPGGERTHIGFLTYDSTLHFYALKPGSSQPQMMVVAELDDPFVPAPDDLLVNLSESREAVEALLDMLPGAFKDTSRVESAMGPAVQAAYMAMSHIGGKLMVFQCTLPSLGSGRLLNRGDDHRNAGTDKEAANRAPADPFYKKMAAECSRQQICVDVFASASPYADLASLSTLPRYTGGELYYYGGFRVERDGPKLTRELTHNLTRFTAWEAVCRVRCSKGFRVSSFNGHFFIRSMDLLALPATNADTAYAVQLAHDEVMPTTNHAFIQCALLYTNADGERRIRVHTMVAPVVQDVAEMYRAIDGGAMSAFLTRLGVERALTARLQDAREAVQLKLSTSLKEFRMMNTSAARAFNRLIFPECARLVPLFTLCASKTPALRGHARDVPVDQRILSAFEIMSAPTEAILRRLYPAMYALHAMPPESGVEKDGVVQMPPRTALAGERIDARGAYLVDDGYVCLLWLGTMLDPAFAADVFGPAGPPPPEADFTPPTIEGSAINARVRAVMAEVRRRAANGCGHCTVTVIAQGQPSEALLFPALVEDRGAGGAGAMSYADFLVQLHRTVAAAGGAR